MNLLDRDTFIGHGRIRSFLRMAAAGRRHHAYLFSGPDHLGKDTVARAFVGTVFGREVEEWTSLATHPDFALLELSPEKKNISVELMRGFLRHFRSTSLFGGVKIGVVRGAQDLSVVASNALLKTLEEPPGNALLLLIASDAARIPATVMSRCQTLCFLPVSRYDLTSGLETRGISGPEAEDLACLSYGRPGIALGLAHDPELRTAYEQTVHAFLELIGAPLSERIARIARITDGADPAALAILLDVWGTVLRDALCVRAGNEEQTGNRFAFTPIKALASRTGITKLAQLIGLVQGSKRLLQANVNSRLTLEHIALAF